MAQSKESAALAEQLENETNENSHALLEGRNNMPSFPVDKYTPAVILSYQVGNVPVNKRFLKKGEKSNPRPSVRFMFAAHARDKQGNPIFVEDEIDGVKTTKPLVIRKWTKWLTISYGDNSGLKKLFANVSDLQGLMKSDGLVVGGNGTNNKLGREDRMWSTQFQVFVEKQGEKYTQITKVKIDDELLVDERDIDYSEDYIPYRTVKAFGNSIYLESAVCKLADHIHLYTQDSMVDAPQEEN